MADGTLESDAEKETAGLVGTQRKYRRAYKRICGWIACNSCRLVIEDMPGTHTCRDGVWRESGVHVEEIDRVVRPPTPQPFKLS